MAELREEERREEGMEKDLERGILGRMAKPLAPVGSRQKQAMGFQGKLGMWSVCVIYVCYKCVCAGACAHVCMNHVY